MKIRRSIRIAGWILGPIIVFDIWYVVAADYEGPMISGVYQFKQNGDESTLLLRTDGTFLQEKKHGGEIERARGGWHRYGEGGIDFSKEFLEISDLHPESDGATHGEVRKSFFNLIPYIVLGSDRENGPKFKRVFFHSGDIAQ